MIYVIPILLQIQIIKHCFIIFPSVWSFDPTTFLQFVFAIDNYAENVWEKQLVPVVIKRNVNYYIN